MKVRFIHFQMRCEKNTNNFWTAVLGNILSYWRKEGKIIKDKQNMNFGRLKQCQKVKQTPRESE